LRCRLSKRSRSLMMADLLKIISTGLIAGGIKISEDEI
jgi:hypothetical protein